MTDAYDSKPAPGHRRSYHGNAHPQKLSRLVKDLSLTCSQDVSHISVTDVSGTEDARAGCVIYIASEGFLPSQPLPDGVICLTTSQIAEQHAGLLRRAIPVICENPRRCFAQIARRIYPEAVSDEAVHKTAVISATAQIDPSAQIGPFAVIGDYAIIGAGTVIGAGAEIGPYVTLGTECRIAGGVRLFCAELGSHIRIAENSVIGKRGFGFEGQGSDVEIIPHLGGVVIGSHVDIGACCTIDRGVMGNTVISDQVMIDNQCHIAHNVQIGQGSIIAGQCGVAGSTEIGRNCLFGGKVGVSDHVSICDGVIILGNSAVTKSLDQPGFYVGFPAMPAREFWKQQAILRKMVKGK